MAIPCGEVQPNRRPRGLAAWWGRILPIGLPIALLLAAALFPTSARAQDLEGYTTAVPLQVFLTWPADTTAAYRYNIYRKLAADATYPPAPLNATPIAAITNCPQFQAIIPPASADWAYLANAFGDTATHAPLGNVCVVAGYAQGSANWNKAMLLARARPAIARVMGVAWLDNGVVPGTTYRYQIRRVNSGGTELPPTGASDITITAGVPGVIPTPTMRGVVAGDSKLQILWNKPAPKFAGFNVYRANIAAGIYRRVNEANISSDIDTNILEQAVSPAAHGFTDYTRWDSAGNPVAISIPGIPGTFLGPENGKNYFYKVKLRDILGNEGPFSAVVTGTPADSTPPATPTGIIVTAVDSSSSFRITWPKVTRDEQGHSEKTKSYRVYRYEDAENPYVGAVLVGTVNHPTDSTQFVAKGDSSAGLRSDCGDKSWFFRVEAIDSANLVSKRSAAVGAALPDTTRPENVKGTTAEGDEKFIRVRWELNSDCDIDGYLIYRALCDYGDWIPCPDTTRGKTPAGVPTTTTHGYQPPRTDKEKKPYQPSDCGGPFVLVGQISHADARNRASANITYFDDYSVPAGSPLCYAYLVKAQDHSQNISGAWPVPDLTKEIVVCERLRDKTPPEPAIISGLYARDSAIRVEWIGPPVQDVAAYHVYRAKSRSGPYTFVGGRTVVPPPLVGAILTSPYTPPAIPVCDSIPLSSQSYMSAGTFMDYKASPKETYWYRVLGIDKNGNESVRDSALAVSTFTFKSNREDAPSISSITPMEGPCALRVQWSPAYDPTRMRGFVVFRSNAEDGSYFQLENVVKDGEFQDRSVARNRTYWYRVAILKPDGAISQLSAPRSATHP
ncbi:MAG: hypothetical protein DYG96_09145 [Chlorobi bacterium CHB2]|nr:hypothetical protein [Chlorobi bacterium CHB2]